MTDPFTPPGAPADAPTDPFTPPGAPAEQPPLTPRAITLAVATLATTLLVAGAALMPTPYAVTSPGPTRDTLGERDDTPLIAIDGAPTYPTTGELLLTTVGVSGGEGRPVSLPDLVADWLDSARAARPVEEIYPPDQSPEEIDQQNEEAMISSQEHATVAALEELGYHVSTTLRVAGPVEGSGAVGVIEPDDVLVAIGGTALTSFSDLSAAIDAVEPGATLQVGIERDGVRQDVAVVTTDDGSGRAMLGVYVDPTFDFPVDVRIQIDSIGGPSAGLVFALGIVDKMTEVDETGGLTIAGTGTIDLTGTVGPIGGIRQKMVGAHRDGASWFLAPADNCDEVVGYVPDGLHVVAVSTLAQARAALEAIGTDDTADLPTCHA